ncbi:hypothetical protein HaLaN_01117, partial [Haematococcus lacustris]
MPRCRAGAALLHAQALLRLLYGEAHAVSEACQFLPFTVPGLSNSQAAALH